MATMAILYFFFTTTNPKFQNGDTSHQVFRNIYIEVSSGDKDHAVVFKKANLNFKMTTVAILLFHNN
jgi:hypothetical protein